MSEGVSCKLGYLLGRLKWLGRFAASGQGRVVRWHFCLCPDKIECPPIAQYACENFYFNIYNLSILNDGPMI